MKPGDTMRSLACAALAMTAPAAMADAFCDDLKTVLAAGDERPAPYDSLVAGEKLRSNGKLASFASVKVIRGLPEGAVCTRYIAGVADAVVGGGMHNYVECRLGSGRDVEGADGDAGSTSLKATRAAVIDQVKTCLGGSGWTGGSVEKISGGRLFLERAMVEPATGSADIVLELDGRGTRQPSGGFNTSYGLVLKIRTPTLFIPPPPQ